MLVQDYAKALYLLHYDEMETDALLCKLDVLLIKKGHQRLKPAILRSLIRMFEEKRQRTTPVLTVAKKEHVALFDTSIRAALTELRATESPLIEIDEAITGGYVLKSAGLQIDNTYKTKLLNLYRSITN